MNFLNSPLQFLDRCSREHGRPYAIEEIYRCLGRIPSSDKDLTNFKVLKPNAVQEFISMLVDDNIAKLKISAQRRDWLYCESEIVLFLNGLLWLMVLIEENFEAAYGNRWEHLKSMCRTHLSNKSLMQTIPPHRLSEQAQGVVETALQVIQTGRALYPELAIEQYQEDQLVNEVEDLHEMPPNDAVECLDLALDAVSRELSHLSGYLGALVVGSFAMECKRDAYSDLDICCICNEIPDDTERNRFLEGLDVEPSFRMGAFEHIGMRDADVHLIFVRKSDQDAALQQIEMGRQNVFLDWQIDGYAVSPHYWITGRILADPSGLMHKFRVTADKYPGALKDRIVTEWRGVWEEYSALFSHSDSTGDSLTRYTALHRCNEALFRTAFAMHEVHCNVVEPKWMPIEMAHMDTANKEKLLKTLGPLIYEGNLNDRFEISNDIWGRLVKDMDTSRSE